jgi:hypothetical protein
MKYSLCVAALGTPLVLSGCGIIGLCSNSCPKGWVHASADCGCMQTIKENPSAPTGGVTASCMCEYSNGRYGAWFKSRPAFYGQSNVTVSANTCEYLPLCQLIDDTYTVIRGTSRLSQTIWGQNINLLNGSIVWYAYGFPEKEGSIESEYLPTLARFVLHMYYLDDNISVNLAENSLPTCEAECSAEKSDCLRLNAPPNAAPGLLALHQQLVQKPGIIKATELQQMFNISDDPCKRGDTSLGDGVITNSGDSCTIEASLQDFSFSTYIGVPENLRGSSNIKNNHIYIDFLAGARGNLHFYSHEDADDDDKTDAQRLDSMFGGDIKGISSDGQYAVFSVGSRCLRAKYH